MSKKESSKQLQKKKWAECVSGLAYLKQRARTEWKVVEYIFNIYLVRTQCICQILGSPQYLGWRKNINNFKCLRYYQQQNVHRRIIEATHNFWPSNFLIIKLKISPYKEITELGQNFTHKGHSIQNCL